MAQSNTKVPTHEVFHVVGNDKKARWTKIGVGWENKDGEGMNLVLNYSPLVEGRTVVRKITKQEDAA
jgi:hypothetical protein